MSEETEEAEDKIQVRKEIWKKIDSRERRNVSLEQLRQDLLEIE